MNLQTKIPLEKQSNNLIDYNSKILLLGSCFVENVGQKLEYYKFKNTINPFGILFHPKAIQSLVANAVLEKVYSEDDVFIYNELWQCFEAHSQLSASTKEELLITLNNKIKLANNGINESTHVVITLGTAWVYKHNEINKVVANCHKIPQAQFKKHLLSVLEIEELLKSIVLSIQSINPNVQIIFTVSPVRHLKDGFTENQRSKAQLISAVHNVLSEDRVSYFPSYEIMMDELRDYRFYKEDMIHPSATAIQYIWERFKYVWISDSAYKTMEEVEVIQKGLAHKPFNPNSEAHQKFIQRLETKKAELQQLLPGISF